MVAFLAFPMRALPPSSSDWAVTSFLLDLIGATVIGGISLFGGTGRVLGVFFGVLFLSVVDNGLQLMGLSLSAVFAIKGSVILFAALLDVLRHQMLARG